ncbi:hypothetical protein [Actinoplanes regularis]|uniref:hypothetical protein n=1 Tax=Actinoplanes regularis TaxID=52697 RepID=UPI0019434756|nr:hypothetical protein [Actinoplanes regularis]
MAFRVRLGRLLAHRRADPATVARAASLPAPEVEAVLAGDSVSAAPLRRPAPVGSRRWRSTPDD